MTALSASPVVEYRRHVSRGQQDGDTLLGLVEAILPLLVLCPNGGY
jgi:hypothetical protein